MDDSRLDPPLRRFCDFYREYSPAWLERLGELYAPSFEFRDPFTVIHADLGQLRHHFAKAFDLAASKFLVDDAAVGQDGAYVRWTWVWKWKPSSREQRVPGVTWLRFDASGKVVFHEDLFDTAGSLFDVVPVLGSVLRALKRRMAR